MQQNSDYTLLFPKSFDLDNFAKAKPQVPFCDEVIDYLNALSLSLMRDREARLYPDVVTFAFFCRKANLQALKAQYTHEGEIRLGRGLAFHIAPSNVPVNFAYSLVAGLLSGCTNIVRVSSKDFPQVNLIVRHLALLDDYEAAKMVAVVRYDRTNEATSLFSSLAAVRVIWGGDATISNIRKSQLPPRSFDICFADRYSVAAMSAKAILSTSDEDMKKLAERFYNDTYLFDQNACSAPHCVFWLNDGDINAAKEKFWTAVHDYTKAKYNLQTVLCVDKLTALYRQAANMDIHKEQMPDNYVMRVDMGELPSDIDSFRCAGGYFSEYTISSLNDIAPIVTNRYQTLAYYGIDGETLRSLVVDNRLTGFDRIVPIGETTTFSLTWDGYNLVDTMSRIISLI